MYAPRALRPVRCALRAAPRAPHLAAPNMLAQPCHNVCPRAHANTRTREQHFLACLYWKVSIETCSSLPGKCKHGDGDEASSGFEFVFEGKEDECGWEYCTFAPAAVFEPVDESDQVATWNRCL